MNIIRIAFPFLVVPLILFCESSTIINSNPPGGKVYVNGVYVGLAPYKHTDTRVLGSTTSIIIKRRGCQDLNTFISRDESFEIGPCIGGFFFLIPFLWITGYNPEHEYNLECDNRYQRNFRDDDDSQYRRRREQRRRQYNSEDDDFFRRNSDDNDDYNDEEHDDDNNDEEEDDS